MIWYFWKGFWFLVKVEIEQQSQKLNSFKELVKKAVDAKVKTDLWPRFYACKTNPHFFQGSQLSAGKASIQGQPMQDQRVKKPKSRLKN